MEAQSQRVRFWSVVVLLAAVNAALLFSPRTSFSTVQNCCGSSQCTGECVDGKRINCHCCSGLCWVCGATCNSET